MDIAALLTPGSATPASGVPTVPSPEAAPLGEAFSDLLVAAMEAPIEGTTAPVAATLPIEVLTVEGAVVLAPVEAPAEVPVVEQPGAEATQPSARRRKLEPGAQPIEDRTPIKDPPPIEGEILGKDANAEAPNAPATEQDRPEAKPKASTEAILDVAAAKVIEAAVVVATPVVGNLKGANTDAPKATSQPVTASSSKASAPNHESRAISRSKADPVDIEPSGELTEIDVAPASEDMQAPVDVQPTVVQTRVQEPVPNEALVTIPREGKGSSVKGAKLESAPDLGVVPKVTVEAATHDQPVLDEKAVPNNAKSDQGLSVVTGEAPVAPVEQPEPKTAEVAEATGLIDASAEESPAGGGGDATPNDERSPQDNPVPVAASTVKTAATERPEMGDQRPEVDRHLVVRQVAERIENLVAARPREGVTIHLEPRDLGSVTLVVKGLASALDVQMSASDERVRLSLDSSRPELAQALAPRGIELRELRVAPSPVNASGTAARDAGTNPDGRPRQQTPQSSQPSFANPTGRTATTSHAVVRAPRSGRGVDLLV